MLRIFGRSQGLVPLVYRRAVPNVRSLHGKGDGSVPMTAEELASLAAKVHSENLVPSNLVPVPETGRPMPLPAELTHYAPLKVEPTEGVKVCDLQLRSYGIQHLELMTDFALRAAYYLRIPAKGPIPLPRMYERWTVIKGPFVHAKSKENFERRTYRRLIQIQDADTRDVETWLAFLKKHQLAGVGFKANLFSREPLGVGKEMADKVSLETSRTDIKVPKYVHFGSARNMDVAQRVRELLEDPVFKKALRSDKRDAQGEKSESIKRK